MKKLMFLILSLVALQGCHISVVDLDKGNLCVSNYSKDSNVVITEIYVKEEFSNGFDRVFKGEIPEGEFHFIDLDPGYYAVKITTETKTLSGFPRIKEYETGYNDYKRLKDKGILKVIFDGKGIYFLKD